MLAFSQKATHHQTKDTQQDIERTKVRVAPGGATARLETKFVAANWGTALQLDR